jgi:hypothetical protein
MGAQRLENPAVISFKHGSENAYKFNTKPKIKCNQM